MMDLNDEIERLRVRCIGCAKCSNVCPALSKGGIDPMEVMMGGEADLSTCIMCGSCSHVCRRTDPGVVIKDLLAMERDIHVSQMYRDTGCTMQPQEYVPTPEWGGDDVYVMAGCTVRALTPYAMHAAAAMMRSMGVGAQALPDEACCLHPVQFREMSEPERRSARVAMGESAQSRRIVTLCPACAEELSSALVDCENLMQFLHARIDSLPRLEEPLMVSMEPGCSMMPFRKEMRAVLEAIGCVIVNKSMGCCGKRSPLSPELMADREAESAGADWVVVGCPMCLNKYDQEESGKPVMHLAELVAMAAGDVESLRMHRIKGPGI